jgi:hypothetical protein
MMALRASGYNSLSRYDGSVPDVDFVFPGAPDGRANWPGVLFKIIFL